MRTITNFLILSMVLACFFCSACENSEYEFIDLGENFFPSGINDQSQVVGTYTLSRPFWMDKKIAAIWHESIGFLFLEDEENETSAKNINNLGQVVGICNEYIQHKEQSIFWNSITEPPTKLLYVGNRVVGVGAFAINDLSTVVGTAGLKSGGKHAFVWDKNNGAIDLHPSYDKGESQGLGINIHGQAVGVINRTMANGEIDIRAFTWTSKDGLVILELLGNHSYAYDINDEGTIVGTIRGNAFSYSPDGVIADLGRGRTEAINNHGEIVGVSIDANNQSEAVIWKNGEAAHLNKLIGSNSGWLLENAVDINDKGEIVGVAVHEDNKKIPHGFLLRPKKEPTLECNENNRYIYILLPLEL